MSLDNTIKNESQQTSTGCATSGVKKTSTMKPPEQQILKCPRCTGPKVEPFTVFQLVEHYKKLVELFTFKKKKTTRPSSSIGGLSNLFTGLSPPAMDFQLNGLNQFLSPPFTNLDSLRLNFLHRGLASFQEFGITNNNLASSIESLSSINLQQQQRLASLFSGVGGENEQQNQIVLDSQAQKLRPITFQNMETSKPSQTEWFNRKHMG
ncbi:hypothetical protein Tco_1228332 [Tanacetum coccineum]